MASSKGIGAFLRAIWLQCLNRAHDRVFGSHLNEVPVCLGAAHNVQPSKWTLSDPKPSGSWQWDGLLWAVPKHRRTNQVNMTRRRAKEKLYKRTTDLVACEKCGNPRRIGFLCSHCLKHIREETHKIKDALFASWKENNSGEVIQGKENVILYEGEEAREQDKNKNIVEMNRKRPSWFQKDLLWGQVRFRFVLIIVSTLNVTQKNLNNGKCDGPKKVPTIRERIAGVKGRGQCLVLMYRASLCEFWCKMAVLQNPEDYSICLYLLYSLTSVMVVLNNVGFPLKTLCKVILQLHEGMYSGLPFSPVAD